MGTLTHPDETDTTLALLLRWHRGERAAIDELLRRELPWIRQRVHARLGGALHAHGETEDYLHDAVLEVLGYAPKFVVGDADAFRRLMTRIIENLLRDRNEYWSRRRRAAAREAALPDDSVLCLDARARTATTPSEAASKGEETAWLRLALELLAPDDRDAIVLREYEGLSFAEVGARLGIAENAARMRFQRALSRLLLQVEALRRGEL